MSDRRFRPITARRRVGGFTLLEVLFVVSILSLVALLAMPDPSSSELYRLDLAAAQVAQIVREARDESRRQGRPFEVAVGPDATVEVYRIDDSSVPPVRIETARGASSRQPLALDLGASASTRQVGLTASLQFQGIGTRTSVFLYPQGAAGFLDASGDGYRLQDGTITLAAGDHLRTVSLDPLTCRVTVQ